jgi:poly(3-hydroxybutyrate) depolymerase
MRKHGLLGLAACLFTAVHGQPMNVRGKVTDTAEKPIANAIVELLRAKRKDTTGADGTFLLAGAASAVRHAPVSLSGRMSLERGVLELSFDKASRVRIEIFDARGHLLDRMALEEASAGTYRLHLARRIHSKNLLIVKASIGTVTRAFPYFVPAEAGSPGASLEFSAGAGARLAKVSAVVDTLRIAAAGHQARMVPLSSYDTSINVALDAPGDGWGGPKNPPMRSSGCGKPALKSGTHSLTSAGLQRQYILHVPDNYDADNPSRLIFGMHWMNGSMQAVQSAKYYSYQTYDAEKTVLLVAPQGYTDSRPWRGGDDKDHVFFDDLHRHLLGNLCVDSSRVFMTGFSFGGMITYSLSTAHQHQIRAAAGLGPANYNIYVPPTRNHKPIAWMQTTGMSDRTTPWVYNDAQKRGAKYIALEKAADNGCTIPANNDVPTWKSGPHFCYDFQGCKAGYPVKACTFGGGHTDLNQDPGSNVNWLHTVSWEFFKQF